MLKLTMRIPLGLCSIFCLMMIATGCGSAEKNTTFKLPDNYEASGAKPEGFTASSMHFRKEMPKHKKTEANSWDFYFKHCSMNGRGSYFSKTSYDCTGPYY